MQAGRIVTGGERHTFSHKERSRGISVPCHCCRRSFILTLHQNLWNGDAALVYLNKSKMTIFLTLNIVRKTTPFLAMCNYDYGTQNIVQQDTITKLTSTSTTNNYITCWPLFTATQLIIKRARRCRLYVDQMSTSTASNGRPLRHSQTLQRIAHTAVTKHYNDDSVSYTSPPPCPTSSSRLWSSGFAIPGGS